MVWLIPCLMISSFVLFIASMGELFSGGRPEWVLILYRANQVMAETFPYLMTATISYLLAMHWHLPRPPIALLSMIYLAISSASVSAENNLPTFQIITALITPIYAIPLIAWLMRYPILHLTRSKSAGTRVHESFNLVLPAALTAVVVVGINLILFGPITRQVFASLMHFDYANDPYSFGLTFASLNSLLWFFGIHGYYALLPLVELLQEASRLSESYFLIGETAPYPMNLSFMGTFVFIGGSGATFLPFLAKAGLMKELDLWVVKQATRDVSKLTNVGVYVPVSINLTAETLMDLTVMAQIEEIIRPVAGLIHIELTEESLLADEQRLTWVFNQLHQLGVKIYIDDFGTGYSSLSYLHRFDVDGIKIDRSFVLALVSEKGRKVFANLQLVAHSLDLETIIEGVETQEQLDAMGDEYPFSVQGWFYSKSLNRGDFVEFVQRRNVSKTVPVEAQ
ncbi:EAL domain-containing protein [Vibrio cholerae]